MPADAAGRSGARSGRSGWSWHQLDEAWAQRVVAAAAPRPGDLVLDIGAGTGALTRPLLATGARVIALELHPGRVRSLRRLADGCDRLTVVEADARELRLPRRPFRVVSNLPYAGSTDVLRALLGRGSALVAADVIVQRGTALRFVDGRPAGSARWLRRFRLELGRRVPESAFRPAPRVESVVLRIRAR